MAHVHRFPRHFQEHQSDGGLLDSFLECLEVFYISSLLICLQQRKLATKVISRRCNVCLRLPANLLVEWTGELVERLPRWNCRTNRRMESGRIVSTDYIYFHVEVSVMLDIPLVSASIDFVGWGRDDPSAASSTVQWWLADGCRWSCRRVSTLERDQVCFNGLVVWLCMFLPLTTRP